MATFRLPLRSFAPVARPYSPRFLHVPRRAFASAVESKDRPKRGDFKTLTAQDVKAFRAMVDSPSSILTTIESEGVQTVGADELQTYNQDWMCARLEDSEKKNLTDSHPCGSQAKVQGQLTACFAATND
jgi:hypothetical protein